MSKNQSLIITEDGEVLDQSALVPVGDAGSLKEIIGYNRMKIIARTTYTRLTWDKRAGVWQCSLGEFTDLELKPVAASELYAVWTEQVGKPAYYGTDKPDTYDDDEIEMGYRVAFIEKSIGPCYGDFFGLSRDFAEGCCKQAANNDEAIVKVKGSRPVNTSNGTFYVPKIVS